ncbi:8573_t:CDS:2, partial [Scutellospora calospora]
FFSTPSSDLDIYEPTSEVETSILASSNSINTHKKRKSKNYQICKNLNNTNKKPYSYSRKGGTTTNM